MRSITVKGYKHRFAKVADWSSLRLDEINSKMLNARHKALAVEKPAMAKDVVELMRQLYAFAGLYYLDDNDAPVIARNPANKLIAVKGLASSGTRVNDFVNDAELSKLWRGIKILKAARLGTILCFCC